MNEVIYQDWADDIYGNALTLKNCDSNTLLHSYFYGDLENYEIVDQMVFPHKSTIGLLIRLIITNGDKYIKYEVESSKETGSVARKFSSKILERGFITNPLNTVEECKTL